MIRRPHSSSILAPLHPIEASTNKSVFNPAIMKRQKNLPYWLYGLHTVKAALANPDRDLIQLISSTDLPQDIRIMAKRRQLTVECVGREQLEKLCEKNATHQNIALKVQPLPEPSLTHIMEDDGPIIMLDQVTDPGNIGSILRSAAAFSAAGLILQQRHAPAETSVIAKIACGALERVPIFRAVNLSRVLTFLKQNGYWVIGFSADGNKFMGEAFHHRKIVLVLGAEGHGLRRLTRHTCNEIVSLFTTGGMESLNVSTATSIALYELVRTPPIKKE